MRLLMGVFFSLQKRKNLTAQEKLWWSLAFYVLKNCAWRIKWG
jgi:hypothetical protein